MNTKDQVKIFLVDDDALLLRALEIEFLEKTDYLIETYATGELCLSNLSNNPSVVILDYQLDGLVKGAMNGIETLDKIKEINPKLAVIMLSSQDKIDVAVECMHHKAFDYVVKSETAFFRLLKNIESVLKYQRLEKELSWYMDRM